MTNNIATVITINKLNSPIDFPDFTKKEKILAMCCLQTTYLL